MSIADEGFGSIIEGLENGGGVADGSVTPAKLGGQTAAGQSPFYDGTVWRLLGLLTGATLTNADQTLTLAGGVQYILPSTVPLTVARDKTLSLVGATKGLMMTVYSLGTRAFAMNLKDAGGSTLYTFPASSTPLVATFRMNDGATAWELSGWAPLAAVV